MPTQKRLAVFLAGAAVVGCAAYALRAQTQVRHLSATQNASDADFSTGCVALHGGSSHAAIPWSYLDVTVALDSCELVAACPPGGCSRGGASLEALVPKGAFVTINGGFFEQDFQPSGWLRSGARDVHPKLDSTGGGVLAVRGGDYYIGPMSGLPFDPTFAVQNAPLVVEPGAVSGIHRDDGRRAARTFACDQHGKLHLVLVFAGLADGPTLYESAEFLRAPESAGGLGCTSALNLDGGPSTSVSLAPGLPFKSVAPRAPIAYGVAVMPRVSPH